MTTRQSALHDPLLTPAEAAKALRLSMPTLSRWRNHGDGPAFIRLGYNRVVYRRSAIEAWLGSIEQDIEEKER